MRLPPMLHLPTHSNGFLLLFSLAITYVKAYDVYMTSISATKARAKLYSLILEVQKGNDPVLITGKKGNAVLVSEEDWRAVTETMYLLSIPGMRESIRKGMKEPVSKSSRRNPLL